LKKRSPKTDGHYENTPAYGPAVAGSASIAGSANDPLSNLSRTEAAAIGSTGHSGHYLVKPSTKPGWKQAPLQQVESHVLAPAPSVATVAAEAAEGGCYANMNVADLSPTIF